MKFVPQFIVVQNRVRHRLAPYSHFTTGHYALLNAVVSRTRLERTELWRRWGLNRWPGDRIRFRMDWIWRRRHGIWTRSGLWVRWDGGPGHGGRPPRKTRTGKSIGYHGYLLDRRQRIT